MNKQDYVSVEVAKKLSEKGYSTKCERQYIEKIAGSEREAFDLQDSMYVTVTDVLRYPMVTLFDAQKWLREKGIHIIIIPRYSSKYEIIEYEYRIVNYIDLVTGGKLKGKLSLELYEVYEECLNNAILEALKIL